ncbi:MAG TPA: hypothetical protein VMS08_00210 [Candidatus Saccharimonadia bacterium]|nr:hypothetical protein [Candidatus Saccharimonadia bacterium]
MHALILFIVLAADPMPPAPCPPQSPTDIAWKKLSDANTEWRRLQKINEQKAQVVKDKQKALADQVKTLQGEIDDAITISTSAFNDAEAARKALVTAGNAYADIVEPGGAEKKPVPIAPVATPAAKPITEKPKVKVDIAPSVERPKIVVYYGVDCIPCHKLMTAINNASAANQLGDYDITYQLKSSAPVPLTDLQYCGNQFQYQGYATYELWLKWVKDQIASVPK